MLIFYLSCLFPHSWVLRVLCIFWIQPFITYMIWKYFLLLGILFFHSHSTIFFFWRTEFLTFDEDIDINNNINVYLLVSSFFFDRSARILSILLSSQKTDFVFIDFYPSFLSSISLIRAWILISFHVLSIPFICFFPACEGGCWGHWFQTKEKWNHTCTQRLLYKCSQKLHF